MKGSLKICKVKHVCACSGCDNAAPINNSPNVEYLKERFRIKKEDHYDMNKVNSTYEIPRVNSFVFHDETLKQKELFINKFIFQKDSLNILAIAVFT